MQLFINDFNLNIQMNGDADNFALVSISDARENACNKVPYESISIEHATPELIGEAIAKYIRENLCENRGYTVVFYPWDDDAGKPRVAGRFKTEEEKDSFLKDIRKPDSGWLEEELASISVIEDYWYTLPL